jgi:hypothetical protein
MAAPTGPGVCAHPREASADDADVETGHAAPASPGAPRASSAWHEHGARVDSAASLALRQRAWTRTRRNIMHLVNLFKGLVIAMTGALVMACGGSPADKMMSYQEKVVSIVESNKKDLDKAAKEVSEYLASNKDAIKATQTELMKMTEELEKTPEKLAELMKEFEKRGEALKARMEALEKEVPDIRGHQGLKDAMRDMPE